VLPFSLFLFLPPLFLQFDSLLLHFPSSLHSIHFGLPCIGFHSFTKRVA
jgi:hypothetical protein